MSVSCISECNPAESGAGSNVTVVWSREGAAVDRLVDGCKSNTGFVPSLLLVAKALKKNA